MWKGALGTAVTRHVLGILGTKRHPLLGVQIAEHGGHIDTTQAVWGAKVLVAKKRDVV